MSALKIVRATRGLSQIALALRAGVDRQKVWSIERGLSKPSPEQREALARALDVDPSMLWPESEHDRRAVGAFVTASL